MSARLAPSRTELSDARQSVALVWLLLVILGDTSVWIEVFRARRPLDLESVVDFDDDFLARPRSGGRLRLLATIQDAEVMQAILKRLNLPSRAPPRAPSRRAPTELELGFGELPIHDN